ncbi:MAG: cytochrome c biogenesis protein CcsA [Kangiellaceae bacterium]|nr:cytochrome c biogenesis protein CcsA [Kangiellaceae bacterium]MCW8998988.1 cytochrome c biogenesis protein CcsA [Kangiellaceae bacterium]
MLVTSLEVISILLYLGIFSYSWQLLSQGKTLSSHTGWVLLIALITHGYLCYKLIDGGEGQNLGLFNIFSMTTWLAMCLVGWNLFRHKAHSLLLVTLPIAIISIIEAAFLSGSSVITLSGKPLNLLHIFTGIAAMSILLLSALQSALVLYLDRGLKHHPAAIHSWLGPLQGMERYLIQLLTVGFILMSVSLFLVLWLPNELKSAQAIHKIVLTIASWIILASLMFGRYIRGWRGVFAAKWSLLGVFLLLLGYFGSKLVIEYIVN